jgi:hypothetical protein
MSDIILSKLCLSKQIEDKIRNLFGVNVEIESCNSENKPILSIRLEKNGRYREIEKEIMRLYKPKERKKLIKEISKIVEELKKESLVKDEIEKLLKLNKTYRIKIKHINDFYYLSIKAENKTIDERIINDVDELIKEILRILTIQEISNNILIEKVERVRNNYYITVKYKNNSLLVGYIHNIYDYDIHDTKTLIKEFDIGKVLKHISKIKEIIEKNGNIKNLINSKFENKKLDKCLKQATKRKSKISKGIEYYKIKDHILGIRIGNTLYIVRPTSLNSIELYTYKVDKKTNKLKLEKYVEQIDNYVELLYHLSNGKLPIEEIIQKTYEYTDTIYEIVKSFLDIKNISSEFDNIFTIIKILEKDRELEI